jgi:DNA gyrase/topoisomerase IV subunit B
LAFKTLIELDAQTPRVLRSNNKTKIIIIKVNVMSNSNSKVESIRKGRPEVKPLDKRNQVIKLFVTKAEKEWFIEHQENAGYKQLSRFAYDLVYRLVNNGRFSYEVPIEVNKDLQRSISGIANNINQAIAFTHSAGNVQQLEDFRTELQSALKKLKKVKAEIKSYKEFTQISLPDGFAILDYILNTPNKAA